MEYVRLVAAAAAEEAAGRRCCGAAGVNPGCGIGNGEGGAGCRRPGSIVVGVVDSTLLAMTIGIWNVLANDSIAAIDK